MTFRTGSARLFAAPLAMRLLGLGGLDAVARGRIQLAEAAAARRQAMPRAAMHGGAAALAVLLGGYALGPAVLAVWLGALAGAIWLQARLEARIGMGGAGAGSLVPHYIGAGVLHAALWAALAVMAARAGAPPLAVLGLAATMAMVMAVAGLVFSGMLVATLAVTAAQGAALAVAAVAAGYPAAALTALAATALLGLSTVQRARLQIERRLNRARLDEHAQVVRLLLHDNGDGEADWLWQTDEAGRIEAPSARFAAVTGQPADQLQGKTLEQVLGADDPLVSQDAGQLALGRAIAQRRAFTSLLVRVSLMGHAGWWEISGRPRRHVGGAFAGYLGVASDVTRQRETSDRIAFMAQYDSLTRLPNRLMLNTALTKALELARQTEGQCGFMMLDLDRFKAVNDTLGHPMGDKLLCAVAGRLGRLMHKGELVGRLGGDEFAVVLSQMEHRRIDRLAQAIIEQISAPYEIDGHTLRVGTSIGSVCAPAGGSTVEELMRNADLALYRAKERGRMQHCSYHPSFHIQAQERRQRESALHEALEKQAFCLLYQPVVEAASEGLVGFEALLRWRRPGQGDLTPDRFLPIAEEAGLIVPIGHWVLQQACQQAASWRLPLGLQLNLSASELLDEGFAETLVRVLSQTGLAPHRLELEVTERVFQRDPALARKRLNAAMALGCRVALDDFGTGYSALSHLRDVAFSTVKVDRTFTQGAAANNPEYAAMIRAAVTMAQSLDMQIIAEGVETDAELEAVRALGCGRVQGYLFGRPMTADQVEQLLVRQHAIRVAGG